MIRASSLPTTALGAVKHRVRRPRHDDPLWVRAGVSVISRRGSVRGRPRHQPSSASIVAIACRQIATKDDDGPSLNR